MKDWDLYLVTEEKLSPGRSTLEVVKEAVAGGVDVIQLREKNLTTREKYNLGQQLKKITDRVGVDLIINDNVDLALVLEADGVHLGEDDLPITAARKLVGPEKIIGLSASNLEEVSKAKEQGADYVGFGAVYQTTSKEVKASRRKIGIEKLKQVSRQVEIPIIAIGGINQHNAGEVIKAGADSAAVISALTQAEDIKQKAVSLKKVIADANS